MTAKVFAAAALLIFLVSADAASAQTRCPIIVAKKAKEYQNLSSRDFVCYSTSSRARRAGNTAGNFVHGSAFQAMPAFSTSGIGRTNSPAFRVTSRPVRVDFAYTGSGDFTLELINQTTGRAVEVIAQTKGAAAGTTYVNQRGIFYLRIEGDNERVNDAAPLATWDVTLTSP